MTRRVAAVLFDMDGTLVDSEKLWTVALDDLAASLGGRLSPPARAAMVGTNMAVSMAILYEDLRLTAAAGELVRARGELEARVAELFAAGLPWRPGAEELLDGVRSAGLPTALVTATRRRLVDIALRTLGTDRFDVVVAGDEVDRGKPDPEPYAAAAAALGMPPRDCVAIEDSPTGTASAVAAGCRVLVVPSEVPMAPDPAYTLVPTLVGVTASSLAALA